MSWRFDDRVAIVTGSGRGLGRAYALLLASRGASVVVNDYDAPVNGDGRAEPGAAEAVVDEIRAAGGRAVANTGSVAADDTADALVDAAVSSFGRVDIVVNNAGIQVAGPFAELTHEQLRRVMDVHFFGTAFLCQAAWPHLVDAGNGRIVNTVSAAVFGTARYGAYGAAKGAIFSLTRALAEEGAPVGIKVNAVAPLAGTRMALSNPDRDPEQAEMMARQMPADLVAPIVGVMAHVDCPFTGEVFSGASGRAARWLLGEVGGFHDPQLDVERLADNLATAMDEQRFQAVANTGEWSAFHRANLT
jgi:NAD(P)-dependent dehydrogenase (short-subunit alcohol dehydrogenase family)